MRRKIMILGAGVYQVPLIKKARQMGLHTVVVSPLGYPGVVLADSYVELDTTDEDAIVRAARDSAVSGVVTTGTDVCVPSLGKVVDALGLAGTGYEAARRSMDKVLMKQAFMRHGVPTAQYRMFTRVGEAKAYAEELGYPVMVKAPDSSGSRGITKVSTADGFNEAWESAWSVSRSKEVIVEQFLDGIEYGAQAFVHRDRVVAVFPHGDTVTPAPWFSPIGHSMPVSLSRKQQQCSEDVIEQAVKALGIRDCVSNVDLMLVDGEPVMIEIGARMGATCLPENVSIYSGMDAYEHLIRLALGEHPEVRMGTGQPNACLLLRSHKTGTVSSLHVPEEVLNHPDLLEFHWDVVPGDHVRAFRVGPDRIGHLVVKADTAEAAERLAEEMVSQIRIDVAEE